LGPNAFAFPGGYIAMTDELVQLLADQPDAVQGILAHELGHVVHRDGLDMLVRSSLVSALVGVVLGDASGFVATVPATLATQAYSRDAERAADQFAAEVLSANGISPAAMAVFFERIAEMDGEEDSSQGLPIAIGSNPEHDERIRFFREWR
jgi:Zn-dependent protease with chaperone function